MQMWHGIRIFLVNPWCSQVELDIERSNKWIKHQLNNHISWLHTFQSFTALIIGSWKSQQVLAVIHLSIDSIIPRIRREHLQEPPGRNILDISSSFSQQAFPSVSQTEVSADLTELGWPPEDDDFFSDWWTTEDLHDFYVGITWNHSFFLKN